MSFNWSDYQLKSFVVIGLFLWPGTLDNICNKISRDRSKTNKKETKFNNDPVKTVTEGINI